MTDKLKYIGVSLAQVSRIYLFLKGNKEGLTTFQDEMKSTFPNAKVKRGNSTRWWFKKEDVWNFFLKNSFFYKRMHVMKICNSEQLHYRTMNYFLDIEEYW